MFKYLRIAFSAAALLLVATDAAALCPIYGIQVYVGDKAGGDTWCTYNSIQDALDASYNFTCPATVRITHEHDYTSQHLSVIGNGSGKLLTLQGEADGVTCYQLAHCLPANGCHADTTQPLVIIDGSNTPGSVLTITGNANIVLRDLTITHGLATGAYGGGINFDGTGSLYLDSSTVSFNSARYGGGISIDGDGAAATLTLGANSLVLNNNAQYDGGGIYVTGQSRLFALQPQILIGSNQTPNGYGGGVAVIGPARADLGSPGYNIGSPGSRGPAISNNSAQSGGGIAVIDNGSGEAVLRVFATSASQPTAIENNSASGNGGGIFLTGQADACLFGPYFYDNIAEDGAAVYYSAQVLGSANYVADSGIYINGGSPNRLGADCGPELVADLGGSRDCLPYDGQCNAFVSSTTQHADTTPAPGSVISMDSGNIIATRFRIRASVAGNAIYIGEGNAVVSRCLITDNGVSNYLVFGWFGSRASFHNCTIANNIIDGGYVFEFGYYPQLLDLANDVVDEPGIYTAYWDSAGGGGFNVNYVLTNNVAGLPSGNPSIVQGLPTFVDAANGDYHLAPIAQKALDFGNTGAIDYDLDGGYPTVDLPSIPNFQTNSEDVGGDLGAYERQNPFYNCGNNYSIFCDGFNH